MAKYESAIRTEDESLIHIEDVEGPMYGRKAHFICPCCKLEMRPVLGEINEHHFRHKGTPCKYDSYLHSLAEETFLKEYNYCLDAGTPFIIECVVPIRCNGGCVLEVDRDCREHYVRRELDLTKHYTKIRREKRVVTLPGSFRRPDVLLETESGEQLWVELFVTHKSSDVKIREAVDRNAKVIEIKITDEHCEGLKAISNHHLSPTDDIVYYNISFDPIDPPEGFYPPCMKYLVYKVESEGRRFPYVNAREGCLEFVSQIPTELEEGIEYLVALRLNFMSVFSIPLDEKWKGARQETFYHLRYYFSRLYRNQSVPDRLKDLLVCEFRRPSNDSVFPPRPAAKLQDASLQNEEDDAADDPIKDLSPSNVVPAGIWVSFGSPNILWCDKEGNDTPVLPDGYVKCLPTLDDVEELKKCSGQEYKDGYCYFGLNGNKLLFKWDVNYLLKSGGTWTWSIEDGDFYAARDNHVCRYVAKPIGAEMVGGIDTGSVRQALTDEQVQSLFPKEDVIHPSYVSPACFHKEDPGA